MDTLSYVLAMEEISKIDASTSVCMSVNNSLVCWGLDKFGNEEQKQKYLVPPQRPERKLALFVCLNQKLVRMRLLKVQRQSIKEIIICLMERKTGLRMVLLLVFIW